MSLFDRINKNKDAKNRKLVNKTIEKKEKKNFLVIGKIIRNPKISVANPGIINRRAAMAIAAPEITSYAGVLFLLS